MIEQLFIPLADGHRLSARIWLPANARALPVPAILEYLPYRLGDGTAADDHIQMTYLAGHGYAGVRVDIRGSGDADGILCDEYLPLEQADCLEVLTWIAAQPWCTGDVAMTGASWGGFNGLQVAALAPPELKAVMSFYASDDRYADDVHYRGGCLLAMDMLQWATSMLAFNAKPPDPAVWGERWRDGWLQRLDGTPPFIEPWLEHQRRDAYWRQGSVCEDYAAIRCPVYAVGGWTDGYTDAVLRLLASLDVPRKGLIGPWGHNDPVAGVPGPAIGMLQESVRFFDATLKGIANGIFDEPMLRVFEQDRVPPRARIDVRPGRWIAEDDWPSNRIRTVEAVLRADAPLVDGRAHIGGSELCGLDGGAWCADGRSADLPPDQRADDGWSLCFDSEPLAADLAILGFVEVPLAVSADRPVAQITVRLCDVSVDGSSALVTRGFANLTHRDGHEHVRPLVPGEPVSVTVRCDAIAHRFAAGQRLRVAVAPTYWPLLWPSPEPVTLAVHAPTVVARLPVRPAAEADHAASPFGDPESPPPLAVETLSPGTGGRSIRRDLATDLVELRFDWDLGGRVRLSSSGIEAEETSQTTYAIRSGDPLSARVECRNGFTIARGDWQTRGEAWALMTCTAETFVVETRLDAFEGDAAVFSRTWRFTVPRDGT